MRLDVGVAERPLHREDRALVNLELGLFGVFDGLGGEGNGAEAAEVAAKTVEKSCRGVDPSMAALVRATVDAQNAVLETGPGNGYTTATICWIHAGIMDWVSLGDSRIYIQPADGRLAMASRDEGHGNIVDNYLGEPWQWLGARQKVTTMIGPGARILLVTDGITGDWKPDLLTESDLEAAITGREAQAAADQLIEVARKQDDRTAIVIDVLES